MKFTTLLYHDAVMGESDLASSGFLGSGSDVYKMDVANMDRHFDTVASCRGDKPALVLDCLDSTRSTHGAQKSSPWFLTFDDGGVSSSTHIAGLLAKHGWQAHFLITGNKIGEPGFVSPDQIRALRDMGHVIGAHSWSHPPRLSACTRAEIRDEWSNCMRALSDILQEPITVASVPGGFFSTEVAQVASECGLRALFTSEPVKKAYWVDQCLILGRFTLQRGMQPSVSEKLVSSTMTRRQSKDYLLWNTKKFVKRLGGKHYEKIRETILTRKGR